MYLYQIYQSHMAQTAVSLFPLFVGAVSVEGVLLACMSDLTADRVKSLGWDCDAVCKQIDCAAQFVWYRR